MDCGGFGVCLWFAGGGLGIASGVGKSGWVLLCAYVGGGLGLVEWAQIQWLGQRLGMEEEDWEWNAAFVLFIQARGGKSTNHWPLTEQERKMSFWF